MSKLFQLRIETTEAGNCTPAWGYRLSIITWAGERDGVRCSSCFTVSHKFRDEVDHAIEKVRGLLAWDQCPGEGFNRTDRIDASALTTLVSVRAPHASRDAYAEWLRKGQPPTMLTAAAL